MLAESRLKHQRACGGSVSVPVVDGSKPFTSGATNKSPSFNKLSRQTSSTDSQEDHSSQGPELQPSLVSVVKFHVSLSVLPHPHQ